MLEENRRSLGFRYDSNSFSNVLTSIARSQDAEDMKTCRVVTTGIYTSKDTLRDLSAANITIKDWQNPLLCQLDGSDFASFRRIHVVNEVHDSQ